MIKVNQIRKVTKSEIERNREKDIARWGERYTEPERETIVMKDKRKSSSRSFSFDDVKLNLRG